MSLISKSGLKNKLQNKKYRDAFVAARISQTFALQARVLRQKAKMSQQSLADALGTSQNAVFRVENPKYGKHSLATLRRWASFFDVGLVVRFAPYSEIVDWTTNLSQSSMEVPDFSHDAGFNEIPMATAKPEFMGEPMTYQAHVNIGAPNYAWAVEAFHGSKGLTYLAKSGQAQPPTSGKFNTDIYSGLEGHNFGQNFSKYFLDKPTVAQNNAIRTIDKEKEHAIAA